MKGIADRTVIMDADGKDHWKVQQWIQQDEIVDGNGAKNRPEHFRKRLVCKCYMFLPLPNSGEAQMRLEL